MKKENIYKQLRESTETFDRRALTQGELSELFNKEGNPLAQSVISKLENNEKDPPTTSFDVLKAYSMHFNVTTDYLLGLRKTKCVNENVAMISKATGLTETSIKTLSQLKQHTFSLNISYDYVIHTLNTFLSTPDSTYLFELLYHYLYGDYSLIGHCNSIGEDVYDGSEIFASDHAHVTKLSLDANFINSALLTVINEHLALFKNRIKSEPANYGKITPNIEILSKKISLKSSNLTEITRNLKQAKATLNRELSFNNKNVEDILDITRAIVSLESAKEYTERNIEELQYTLKEISN